MPMPLEPIDKYELMDNMHMLDQQELDRLTSFDVDPDVSQTALSEIMARSATTEDAAVDSKGQKSKEKSGDKSEVVYANCPDCGRSGIYAVTFDCPDCQYSYCKMCSNSLENHSGDCPLR